MAINTAGDLIGLALRTAGITGVGQTAQPEDANDALALLQMMVASFQQRRWLIPNLIDMAIVSTGARSYSIGPAPPARIDAAYCRFPNASGVGSIDYPLAIIESHEAYANISLKSLSTLPSAVFYDSAWPIGQLYFWPIPPVGYELHILTKGVLTQITALTDPLNMPPEYLEAMLYGLAIRLAMNYGMDPRPAHVGAYRAALNGIRMANVQPTTLEMPSGVFGGWRGGMGGFSNVFGSVSGPFVLGSGVL